VDQTVARAGMFHGVESAVALITKQLRPVDFARRQLVFAQGESANRLYIIVSGKVKISHRSPEGREHLLAIMGPPEIFGEVSVFDDGPRTASATALTDVRAVSLDRETLRGWMVDRPEVAEQLLRVLARRLRRADNRLTDQIFTDVPGRVARQLLLLAQQFGTRDGDALRVAHDLTQVEIAQLVGASREATNQALSTFAERGWIQSESHNTLIFDAESLARRAR
jgi:CRP/FNR family transcriptional regulator, cyclic AMP receptor protein